ncbi:uncharacterized protein B0H18DRAFT_1087477 [Fomitopsis serialis]|uniref:uncharacterized protein n=1 Tax=Fomitopsis serialis TaxID=139415 RepID=UPI002008A6AD|nr:uncharacterized protein B0H18DRAFT_1087477 [Neoantrodia serialis]KAH9915670.1 hypothetical protein B0H18DRAFT_1087477 [Neoantrodia serialis]
MSTALLRSQAARSVAASARATPVFARAAYPHVRTYAVTPDPTQPTDSPTPSDVPKPEKSNMLWILGGVTAASVGAWYYLNMEGENVHEKRQKDAEEAAQKARELSDAGKRTAQDAVKEGQKGYYDLKAAGKDKLHSAEATANEYAADTRGTVTKQYDAAKASAADTYNAATAKVGDAEAAAKATYADAKQKANETTQSWGSWFGSWFGYGKKKAEAAESRTAADVAASASKVQREAEKRE